MPAALSASGLARAHACPAAFALPACSRDGADARRGREIHLFLQALADGTPTDDALDLVPDPEVRAWCARIDRRQVPVGAESEVAMAYHVTTGQARKLGPAGHRDYGSLAAAEIPGTADLVGWASSIGGDGPVPWVLDWKTVQFDHDAETSRPQLEFYALCVARITGAESVECRVRVVSEDGAIGDGGTWRLEWDDLARIAAQTRTALEAVRNARLERAAHEARSVAPWTPDVGEGPACRYCPAFGACPGKRAAVAAVLGSDPHGITEADAGVAHLRARDAITAAERVKDVVRLLVDQHGSLSTGDGRIVRRNGAGALVVVRA